MACGSFNLSLLKGKREGLDAAMAIDGPSIFPAPPWAGCLVAREQMYHVVAHPKIAGATYWWNAAD